MKAQQDETELKERAKQLTKLIIGARTDAMRKMYETQAEDVANQLEDFDGQVVQIDLAIPYRTALDKSIGLLKKPHIVWEKLSTQEQQQLFYFIFEQKLRYNQETGYRTAQIPHATRLFEEFVAENTNDVEVGVLKPRPGFGPMNFYLDSRFGISPEDRKPDKITSDYFSVFSTAKQENDELLSS